MNGLAKIADTSMVQDFLAGADPSGTRVFQNAMNNEGNEEKHRLATSAGGFAGGALIGTLAPAALMGGTALATKKVNPGLAEELAIMGKGTIDALNPAAMYRHVKAINPLTSFKNKGGEFLNETKNLSNLADNLAKGNAPNPDEITRGVNTAKNLRSKQKELQDVEEELSQKYYKGKPVAEGGSRTFTALSTAGAGALSGLMGATSAGMQYNTGTKARDMNNQNEPNQIKNLAKVAAENRYTFPDGKQ